MRHYQRFFAILEAFGRDRQKARAMAAERMAELDAPLARIGEGLVDLLIARGLLSLHEVSPDVRRIMAERHSLRVILKV